MRDLRSFLPVEKFKEFYTLLRQDEVGDGRTMLDVLQDHLTIYKSKLDEHYAENSAIIAFWAGFFEREQYKLTRLKRKFEQTYAGYYIRQKGAMSQRVSETEIKNRVMKNKVLTDLQDHVDILTYKVGLLSAIVHVMKERNNNVINLGASMRKEMGARDSTRGPQQQTRVARNQSLKAALRKV